MTFAFSNITIAESAPAVRGRLRILRVDDHETVVGDQPPNRAALLREGAHTASEGREAVRLSERGDEGRQEWSRRDGSAKVAEKGSARMHGRSGNDESEKHRQMYRLDLLIAKNMTIHNRNVRGNATSSHIRLARTADALFSARLHGLVGGLDAGDKTTR